MAEVIIDGRGSGNFAGVTESNRLMVDTSASVLGSPAWKTATATASGTYTQVWEVGAGSRIEIHGWKVSTNAPGYVSLVLSGTSKTLIADYYLEYASGAVVEKSFNTPFIPGEDNIHIGFGTHIAGSTSITIYGREVD